MNNYSKISLSENGRTELHDALSLTGAEISVNSLPAGASVPFVHVHRQNEEIYAVPVSYTHLTLPTKRIV